MKDEDIEMKFKLEMDVITPIPRTITRKFSSLRHMRQWKNRNEIDSCLWCVNCRTYTRNAKRRVGTVYHIRQTNRSEIRNGERTPTHGSERIQPAET